MQIDDALIAKIVRLFDAARNRCYRDETDISEFEPSIAAGEEAYQEYRRRMDFGSADLWAKEVMLRHYLARAARAELRQFVTSSEVNDALDRAHPRPRTLNEAYGVIARAIGGDPLPPEVKLSADVVRWVRAWWARPQAGETR